MISKRSHLVGVVAVGAFASLLPAGAGAEPSTGFYVGGGLGEANYNIDYGQQVNAAYSGSQFTVVYANMTRSHDLAGKAFVGYQFANPFAIELGYVNLGEPQAQFAVSSRSVGTTNPFTRSATYRIQGLNLAAVGRMPLNDHWSLHASVGAFYSQYKYSESGYQSTGDAYSFTAPNLWQTNLSYGLGIAAQLGNQWSVRGDWDRYQHVGNTFSFSTIGNGRFSDIDLFSLNLEYSFQ